jgi:hypothetical protein
MVSERRPKGLGESPEIMLAPDIGPGGRVMMTLASSWPREQRGAG